MSAKAAYWQHGEKVEELFADHEAAHGHMIDLWAEGECSPVAVVHEDGTRQEWGTRDR